METGTAVDPGYPRPLLRRERWRSLNGRWEFALDRDAALARPEEVEFDRTIVVPFAPETPASGIGDTGLYRACWYRRRFDAPPLAAGERLLLHFGAVDHEARVWIDGRLVAQHEGGYTPFFADITDALDGTGEHLLVVHALDDPADLAKPRGKQDWKPEAHEIWYPRTTGVWQTVWLEPVPATRIGRLTCIPAVDRWAIDLDAEIGGEPRAGLRLHVRMTAGERLLADDVYSVEAGEVARTLALSDPGIDSSRKELLWRPSHPTLLDLDLQLLDADGTTLDRVRSYTALRSVDVAGDRFLLNRRPYNLRLVLDQGYWPETGLTPPSDEALQRDIELVKAMGFNGVRKHQKLEDPRFLHWADVLGLVVFGEMPSAYRFTRAAVRRVVREWTAAVERDRGHPCIVAWVPLNESWGVPDLPVAAEQRDWVRALYHLTRTLDPSRPVIGNDGWEAVATDVIGIHDYDDDPDALRRRYAGREAASLLRGEWPGGRMLAVGDVDAGAPLLLSEFGGISLSTLRDSWGYSEARDADDLATRYERLLAAVHDLELAGFCYTQLTDTYQETNGLLTFDRVPKVPLERLARATYGPVRGFVRWIEPPPWEA